MTRYATSVAAHSTALTIGIGFQEFGNDDGLPAVIGHARAAWLKDSEGNLLGIAQLKH